ncbi:MAG: tyrosine-type recombinase/integrase [Acidobacteria bacterium]|nr:tyrosine-type recombinase/integrase [Acidobacteriota bacterium]
MRRQLKPAYEKSSVGKTSWHALRHANVTFLDSTGTPLGTVQAHLGHSSSEITRPVYLHSIPEEQRRTVKRGEAGIWTQARLKLGDAHQRKFATSMMRFGLGGRGDRI